VREAVVAHDQRGQAIRERVDAGARLRVGALIGPHNVEARIDAGNSEPVQGRVAEGQRRQIVRVGELSAVSMLARLDSSGPRTAPTRSTGAHTYLVYDLLQHIHGQVQQSQRARCSLLFPLRRCFVDCRVRRGSRSTARRHMLAAVRRRDSVCSDLGRHGVRSVGRGRE
jgi:hypothetical protein